MSHDLSRLNEDKKIRRRPIVLNDDTIAVIHVFKRYQSLDDIWMWYDEKLEEENYSLTEESARQFMIQLEGEYSVKFLKSLRDEIDLRLKDDPAGEE